MQAIAPSRRRSCRLDMPRLQALRPRGENARCIFRQSSKDFPEGRPYGGSRRKPRPPRAASAGMERKTNESKVALGSGPCRRAGAGADQLHVVAGTVDGRPDTLLEEVVV